MLPSPREELIDCFCLFVCVCLLIAASSSVVVVDVVVAVGLLCTCLCSTCLDFANYNLVEIIMWIYIQCNTTKYIYSALRIYNNVYSLQNEYR